MWKRFFLFLALLLLSFSGLSLSASPEKVEVPVATLENWIKELTQAREELKIADLKLVESERILRQARERLVLDSIASMKLGSGLGAQAAELETLSKKCNELLTKVENLEAEKEGYKIAAIVLGIAAGGLAIGLLVR